MKTPIRRYHTDLQDDATLPVTKRGLALVHDPLLNKGTGFPDHERDALGLRGLVPPAVVSIDDQVQRVMENYRRKDSDLGRYIHLEALHDRNETLYYRVLLQHITELMPIVYTPVVGQACQQYGHIYRRARGMYFAASEVKSFAEMVHNWPEPEVDVVVVTDGSRILGLGDLGANGIGIPIGKLALYVAGAGLYPRKTLPVMLDLGTDNAALRHEILYLGERHPRLRGAAYDEAVEAFVQAVHGRWPRAIIQFEDFSTDHAFMLLERYRDRIPCFNDDIQGTGAVTLAGILSALRITGQPLGEQRVLFVGAGCAGRGIADMIATGMMEQDGLSDEQARGRIAMIDSAGLVTRARLDRLNEHKRPYATDAPALTDLTSIIRHLRPTVLIGVGGQAGSFTEAALQEMRRYAERPIVLPLSNPTSKSECTPEQAYAWTDGAALVATGSPFPPVAFGALRFVPGQCNNMYIFPGLGMGAVSCQVRRITHRMFYAAARALAEQVGEDRLAMGQLYPDLPQIREISAEVACAVARVAFDEGLAGIDPPDDLLAYIRARQFQPHYVPYVAA
jgi:malate dehydrogenase (oxaloacetate-decarboxylating)(NADP+)